jgi:aspartate/methionine/tyrosine aminotransferase
VAVLPGVSLGAGGEGFFRIALTVPEQRIREATERSARVLLRIRNPATQGE